MAADATLTRELQSLHQTLAGLHQKRRSRPADSRPATKKTDRQQKRADEHGLHEEILQFIKAIADYVEQAKENVSAHPSVSVLGGMIAGILIGRLLARR